MRAYVCLAALVTLWAPSQAFFPYGNMREVSQNYYEMITHCDKEGGDCIDVDFGGSTDPPPPPPRPTTRAPPPPPTTRAPPPPILQPIFVTFPPFFNMFQFWPTTRAPPLPRPTTRAPMKTTRAPAATTLAPAKAKPTKAPRKRPRKGRKRPVGENEREVRKRRQADVLGYLYNECSGGWEFDPGCGVKGNVCCYSSNSNYRKKK